MKLLNASIIAFVAFATTCANAQNEPTNRGGIVTAIGQRFFDEYKNTLIFNFMERLEQSEWPASTRVFQMPPHLTVNSTASDFKLSDMTFNASGTVLEIHENHPQVVMELSNVNCTFKFQYNITSDPEFIQDIGSGTVQVVNFTPSISGSPSVVQDEDGVKTHILEVTNVTLSADNFNVIIDGGDIAYIISGFSETYTEYIKEYVMTQFSETMVQTLQDTINSNLLNIDKKEHEFEEYGFAVDYMLVDDGIHVSEDFISSIVDGTFHPIGVNDTSIERNFNTMPLYESNGREFQVLISEYSMNTVLRSMIDLDTLDYEDYLTSDQILALIEDFEEAFGDQDEVLMVIKATPLDKIHERYHPKVTITPEESIYEFSLDIHIKNPFNIEIDAMVMQTQITAKIAYSIDSDFRLYSECEEVEAEITKLDSWFQTRTTQESLNDRLQFATPILIGFLNVKLQKGIEIPVPANVTQFIEDPRVRHFENYLFADAKVNFDNLDQPVVLDFMQPIVQQRLNLI